MPPGEELPGGILRDRVALHEAGEQALAEQLHDRIAVPGRQGWNAPSCQKPPSVSSR
jgi:hypothetical protein